MKLSDNVTYILNALEASGYRADIVGGPVRDFLLGKEPHDYDITTSATPDEVKRVFADKRIVDTGIAHGTVTLILDSEPYEITTYRLDGEYTDARHPDSVTFTTDITEDLSRRDFTVNAISYSPLHGFCDPFSGREDIERKLLRAVGDPYARFSEDALRILRCIRFASVLSFSIEERTASAARELAPLLSKISAERIFSEWNKLLCGSNAYDVISEFSDIIEVFLPEIRGLAMPKREKFDALSAELRQLVLFASVETTSSKASSDFEKAMKRLKAPTRVIEEGATVLAFLGRFHVGSLETAGHLLFMVGEQRAVKILTLEVLLGVADPKSMDFLREYLALGRAYRISDLNVDGHDILSLGARGSRVGEVLIRLIDLVIDGGVENERSALMKKADEMLNGSV